MGTKLEHAINPLASASSNPFLLNQLGDWGYSREAVRKEQAEYTILLYTKDSVMDGQMLDLQSLESVKKTMLMHEDIFRQQVRELHRLYERQKKLMYELKEEVAMTPKQISNSQLCIWDQPVKEMRQKFPGLVLGDEPGERVGSWTRPIELNLECLPQEPPSTSVHADMEWDTNLDNRSSRDVKNYNASNVDEQDEEVDVELSLSIGCSSSKKRAKSNGQPKACSMDFGSSDTSSNGGRHSPAVTKRGMREESLGESGLALSHSSGISNRDVAKSNWFIQDLSFKKT